MRRIVKNMVQSPEFQRIVKNALRLCPACKGEIKPEQIYYDSQSKVWGHKGCVVSQKVTDAVR